MAEIPSYNCHKICDRQEQADVALCCVHMQQRRFRNGVKADVVQIS